MDKDKIELPSDLIQKEYEDNPIRIIELMRNGEENPLPEEKKLNVFEPENKNNKIKKEILSFQNYLIIDEDKNKEKKEIYDEKNTNNKNINKNNNNIDMSNNINNIKNNIIINNNINNNNIIINNNITNHYLNIPENSKSSNDKISNISNISYLGNLIQTKNINSHYINNFMNQNLITNLNNENLYNAVDNYKYTLLKNTNLLLMYLNSHKGSIFTQQFLDEIDNKELSILFNNLEPYISEIMCLEYGNYFIQKLIKKLNIQQRLKIYQIIEPKFINIATNKSGTHSIQSLIDCINSPIELFTLDKLINKNTLLFFLDENAYHIMMKIILEIPEDKRNNINLFLAMNAEKIIINCNGAFCVNKFITKNNDLKIRSLLIQNLQNNIHNLVTNKYSCTILLLILEKFGINYGIFIIKYIQNNFSFLSSHPTTMVFIIKTLNYLYKYNSFELGILIWYIYKNNNLLNYLLSNENGKKMLNLLISLSDEEQKKYIFQKINNNNNHKVKDD